jgi:TP901 family phage tail tape measure protein
MTFNLTAALRLNDAGFTRGMRSATRSMHGLKSGAGEIIKTLGLVTTAAAGVGLAFSSVNKAMSFESQMSTIKALTGATNEQMKQMQNLALQMGAKTKYSALEAGRGIEELLKAGLTPATVQAGGLEAALNLATAGGLDLADAAEIMSTALNSFSKDGLKAEQASNILAGTANASATGVMELKESLSQVSAVAAGAGLSFKDTNAALGVMANKGLKGSDAGTSLKTMLLQLQPTTKKQSKLFKLLGLETDKAGNSFYDAQGHIKSMAEIAQVLHEKFKNLTDGQRQAAFKEAFGTDAIRAANILYEAGAKGIKNFQEEMSKVTALDVAKEKMNNAAGAVEQFKGAMETLQISVLLPLMPLIKEVANNMANWVANLKPEEIKAFGDKIKNAFQTAYDWAKKVYDFITTNWKQIKDVLIAVTFGVLAFKLAMGSLMIISTVIKLVQGLRIAYGLLTGAQWALNAAMDANPVGAVILAIAALVAIGVYLYRNWDTVKAKTIELWDRMGKLRYVVLWLLGPIAQLVVAGIKLYQNWDTIKAKAIDVWTNVKQSAASAVNSVISDINKMINILNKIPGVKIPIVPKVNWGAKNPNTYGYSQSNMAYGYSQSRGNTASGSGVHGTSYNAVSKPSTQNKNVNLTVNYKATGHTEQDAKNLMSMMTRMIEKEGAVN